MGERSAPASPLPQNISQPPNPRTGRDPPHPPLSLGGVAILHPRRSPLRGRTRLSSPTRTRGWRRGDSSRARWRGHGGKTILRGAAAPSLLCGRTNVLYEYVVYYRARCCCSVSRSGGRKKGREKQLVERRKPGGFLRVRSDERFKTTYGSCSTAASLQHMNIPIYFSRS